MGPRVAGPGGGSNSCGTHHRAGSLQSRRGPETFSRLADQHGNVASAGRQMEWKVPGCRERRLGWLHSRSRGTTRSNTGMVSALRAGYATAGNDTGHEGANGLFTVGHPEKVIDFAYRAMHEMTVQSKALIKAFYDQSPRLSYYNGCSTGGRQGLMAAQRYPEDFDAILAGAPANDHLYLHAGDMARMIDIFKDPEGLIPQAKQDRLAKAVMNACDALDGVTDNLITNPIACKFDPAVLQCKAGDAADCLTSETSCNSQETLYRRENSKGELIFPGYA